MRNFLLVVGLILIASFARIVPHPPNFTPIAAIALLGAATLTNKKLALILPITLMLISDGLLELASRIGLTQGWMAQGWGFHEGMPVIYFTILLITCIGFVLRENRHPAWILAASLSSSVVFFVITNLAVWMFQDIYPKTLDGFIECYVMAIPFFAYTVIGDLFFVTILFGLYHLATDEARIVAS